MSNLLFNLRIGLVHFQVMRDRPWFRIGVNDYYRGTLGRTEPWIALY